MLITCLKRFAIIFIALIPVAFVRAQSLPPDLDAYVATSMKTFDVPGMAVAVVSACTGSCDDGRWHVAERLGVSG